MLREAVSWLRLAVDLDRAAGRDSGHRAGLWKAMLLLLDRTAVVPETEREGEPPRASTRLTPDQESQTRALGELGSKVAARILPEAEAILQVVNPTFPLSIGAVEFAVATAKISVGSGAASAALPTLMLAMEAASARWGKEPGGPWWGAADAYVEAVRLSLIERLDGALFHRAHDVVRTQIDVLRKRGDTDELAETLYAAGLLHLNPHFGDLPGMAFGQALGLSRNRQDRHQQLHPGDPGPVGDLDMPPPAAAVAAAVGYLRNAADLSSGHALGRVLKSLIEALSFLAGTGEESYDQEIVLAAREAFDVLDPQRDPLSRLFTLRVLHRFGEVAIPERLAAVLPVPLSVIKRRHGEDEASCVFAEALTLAGEAHRVDLQIQLLDAADLELPVLSRDSHRRLRWGSEVEVVPDLVELEVAVPPPEACWLVGLRWIQP
jgi:hypothetical protein